MYIQDYYTAKEYEQGTIRRANERIVKHINRLIIADNIKEKSTEWYLLMQLKTMVHEDRS